MAKAPPAKAIMNEQGRSLQKAEQIYAKKLLMPPKKKKEHLNEWIAVAACELTNAQKEHLKAHIHNEIKNGENFLQMTIKPHHPLAQEISEWFANLLQHTIASTHQQYRVMACGNVKIFHKETRF